LISTKPRLASAERGAGGIRWAVLFFVLLLEYEVITLGVDGQLVAAARGGAWSGLFNFESLGRVAFLCVTTLLVLARPNRALATRLDPRLERAVLILHGIGFVGFWLLTRWMLGTPEAPRGSPLIWISAWAVSAGVSGLLLWLGLMGIPSLRWRALVPLVACAAVAWALSEIGARSQGLWRPFSSAALGLAGALLKSLCSGVVVDAPHLVLELDGFAVRVESGCSGLEGIGMILTLGLAYLFLFRSELRFPRAWGLLGLAVALTWLGNAGRLAGMVWLGARVSPGLALGGFHSKAGWVLFSSVALGMAFVGHHARFFARQGASRAEGTARPGEQERTTAFLMPLLVLLAIGLALGLVDRGEGPWYGLRMLLGLGTLCLFWRSYDDLRWPEPGAGRACLLGGALGLLWLGTWLIARGEPERLEPVSLGWLLVRAVGFSTIVPLAEELAFRGYLLRVLQNRNFAHVPYRSGAWQAIAISSLLFGALHERWFLATLAGFAYALIQSRSGRLRDAVLAHAATNLTLAVFAVAWRNPALFG